MASSKGDDEFPPPPWSPPSPKSVARPVRALPSVPALPLAPALHPHSLPSVDEEASWEERVILSEDSPGLDRSATRLPNYGEAGVEVGRRLVAVNLDEVVEEGGELSASMTRSYNYPNPPETPIEGSFPPDFPSSPTGSTVSSLALLTPSNSTSSSHPRIGSHYSPPPSEPSTSSHSSHHPVEKAHSSPPSSPPPRPFSSNRRSLTPLASLHHTQSESSSSPYPNLSIASLSPSSSTTSSSSSEHPYPPEKARSSSSRSSNSSHTASPPPHSSSGSTPPPPPTPLTIESPEIIPSFDPLIAYNPRPTASGASSLSRSMSAAERRRSLQAQAPPSFTRGGSLSEHLEQLSLRGAELGGVVPRGGGTGAGASGGDSTRSSEGEGGAGATRPRSSSTWSSCTG